MITEYPHLTGVITECLHLTGLVTESRHLTGIINECLHITGMISECPQVTCMITKCTYQTCIITECLHLPCMINEYLHLTEMITTAYLSWKINDHNCPLDFGHFIYYRDLDLETERSGHYYQCIFSSLFFSDLVTFSQEGVVLEFWNFACHPKLPKE